MRRALYGFAGVGGRESGVGDERGSADGSSAGPPAARWRFSLAAEPAAVQPAGRRRYVVYCDGTYVGSCVAESITDAYAVILPVPLSTFTVTRAL
ncbi:MAG: hypothetical protein QOI58_683 [Thermoanaerobaculia bacterium]|nr:hypothetical protein [Thermoanaerobaculia bacterium]